MHGLYIIPKQTLSHQPTPHQQYTQLCMGHIQHSLYGDLCSLVICHDALLSYVIAGMCCFLCPPLISYGFLWKCPFGINKGVVLKC